MASSTAPYAKEHASPNGPGDARPTALQIIEDENLVGKLGDKVILITGCSSGIGVETARALHETGARLFLTVRDMEKGEAVVKDILSNSNNDDGGIELVKMELDSLDSVRAGAAEVLSKTKQLNVLVNNAGIMACPFSLTRDGHELQFATNHLSHFLLFQLLLPTLLSSSSPSFHSRIINVSSTGHRQNSVFLDDLTLEKGGYTPWKGYGQSKTANIHMANQIERLYGARGVHGFSLHPGGIGTPLQRHLDPAFLKRFENDETAMKRMKSVEQGAATTVWAAVAKVWEGKGGKYLEDCQESGPAPEGWQVFDRGYAPWAFDEEAEKKLWDVSCDLVGVEKP